MFGFRLPENFDRPYSAASITDFWRRWHMSLSRWFRDYVYIPLGGNRHGRGEDLPQPVHHLRRHRLLARGELDVPGLGPLPRGADAGRARDRDRRRSPQPAPRWSSRRALTFLLVVVGWVFFRAESMGQAVTMLRHMFVPSGLGLPEAVAASLTNQRVLVLALALVVVLLPGSFVLGRVLDSGRGRPAVVTRFAVMAVAAPCAAIIAAAGTFSPFLYYQF